MEQILSLLMNTRSFAAFVLIALLAAPIASRAEGFAEVDSSSGDTLYGVSVTGSVAYAVGENGTVLYSDDSGATWTEGDSDTTRDLYDVAAISTTKAVAVGEGGIVLRTTDGGDEWTAIEPDYLGSGREDYDLNAVTMASASVGFAVGLNGITLVTDDGGANWEEVEGPIPSSTDSLTAIAAYSVSKLWVVGESGIIETSADGGDTWTSQVSGTGENLLTIDFASSTVGFAAGENQKFLTTTDGGTTWDSVTVSELDSDDDIVDISFLSSTVGMLSSASGELLETDDGGDSWETVESSGSPVLLDISYVSSSSRYGVGEDGEAYRWDATAPSKPTNFDVDGENDAVTDTTPTFSWTASTDGQSEIDGYHFKIDSGSYSSAGNVTTETYSTALSNGAHIAYLYATDLGDNDSPIATLSFTIDADSTSSGSPDVSSMTPSTALEDETVTFSVRVSDDESVESCDLYVDGERLKTMTLKTDLAYATHTFSSTGTHELYARCTDNDDLKTSGSVVTATVSSGSSAASPGDIIKIGCEGDVYVNDPCTAVYYYGKDGLRHAFPNEAAFKSWFTDFDDLVTVSASAMANITLGRNVTFRPGTSLIKFSTNTVYAVSYGGILRPISTEAIAIALFGSDWAADITVVNDVFFANYRIGSDIESSGDYSSSSSKTGTATIDVTF